MTEYFVRHGDWMMMFVWIDDPVYLEEPVVGTYALLSQPVVNMAPIEEPTEVGDEVTGKTTGWVPFWPFSGLNASSHTIDDTRSPICSSAPDDGQPP